MCDPADCCLIRREQNECMPLFPRQSDLPETSPLLPAGDEPAENSLFPPDPNTCRLDLASVSDPRSLGRYPYTPLITGHQIMAGGNLELQVSSTGRVYLAPILSSYVGADITLGILSLQLHRLTGWSLLTTSDTGPVRFSRW